MNGASDWTLWQVEFPCLDGLQASGDFANDRLFYPDCWGVEYRGSAMPRLQRRYPRGWETTMQLLGYTAGAETLYLGVHDPALRTKDFIFVPPAPGAADSAPGRFAVVTFPEGMTAPGNSFATDYDTVAGVLAGDWFDAAGVYAAWARSQAWAAAPPATDAPAARSRREVHAWQVLQVTDKPMAVWAELMERLASRLGVRFGIHFYNWHQIPFDISYPDYFPARAGFKQMVARLNRAGIVTMPYINGRLWDINAPSWTARHAEPSAAKGSAQRLAPRALFTYLEEYGSGQKLAPMCPTTPFWRDTVTELCRRIVQELGCGGVYIDQIAAEKAELCFDAAHGHPLGGGGFWLAGYREMLRQIRGAVGPEPYLTTECNWEGCAADYDALLSWHRFSDELIPMFPAVYAGQARLFGCQFGAKDLAENGGEGFARRMAMLFVWGGQLGWGDLTPLLEPRHAALCRYFGQLCRQRAEHAETFAAGRLLRPPLVTVEPVASPRHRAVAASGTSSVYASLWADAAGTCRTLFVVNPTRRRLAVTLTLRRCDAAALQAGVRGVRVSQAKNLLRLSLALPPLAVRVVRLVP